jgi:hypothetical protein
MQLKRHVKLPDHALKNKNCAFLFPLYLAGGYVEVMAGDGAVTL